MRRIQLRAHRSALANVIPAIFACLFCTSVATTWAASPVPVFNEYRSYSKPPAAAGIGFGGDITSKYAAVLGYRGANFVATDYDVYIYDPATGQHLRTLTQPVPANDVNFRFVSVAIDGDLAVVGANYVHVPLPGGNTAFNAGAAYVYDLTTGQLKNTFVSNTPQSNSNLGYSIDVHGNRAIVGSDGAAYLFDINTGAQLAKFTSPIPGTDFGGLVALSESAIIISGDTNPSGSIYTGVVYSYNPQTFAPISQFAPAAPQPNAAFGQSLAIDGRYAIASSGTDSYVFDALTGTQLQKLTLPGPQVYWNKVDIQGPIALLGNAGLDRAMTFNWTTGAALQDLVPSVAPVPQSYGYVASLAGNTAFLTSTDKAYQFAVVPEPTTLAYLALLFTVHSVRRRRAPK